VFAGQKDLTFSFPDFGTDILSGEFPPGADDARTDEDAAARDSLVLHALSERVDLHVVVMKNSV
jgi:hypothetical protein